MKKDQQDLTYVTEKKYILFIVQISVIRRITTEEVSTVRI